MRRVQKRSRVIAKPKEQVLTKEQQLQQLLTQLKACKAKIKELTKAKVAVQKRLSEAKERLKVGKSLVKNAVVFHKKAVIAFQVSRQKSAKASWKAINEAREAVRSSPMMEKIYFYAGKCDESEEWPCSPHVPHVNRELAFPSHVVNKEIAFSHVQGDWSKSSLVVEAEAAIRETERLAGVVNGAQNAINEAKDKCQEVQDECDEIESELDALDEDLKEANDELLELERRIKELQGEETTPKKKRKPRQPRQPCQSTEPRFTPAAKEALVESLLGYLSGH